MPNFPVIFRLAIALVLVTFISACSASSRIVRVYDGDSQDETQVARIETPATIKMLSINGQQQKTYLTDSIAMTYELLPGEHTIEYQYASIWSVPRGIEREDFAEDTAKVQNVDSAPIRAVIDLVPGGRYRIRHRDATNIRDAQNLAAEFTADIVSDSGEQVVQRSRTLSADTAGDLASVAMEPGERASAGAPKAPLSMPVETPDTVAPSTSDAAPAQAAASSTNPEEISRLDGLKVLWGEASEADKKEFLRWAFQ